MENANLDELFQSGRKSYEIAKLLLDHVFIDWVSYLEYFNLSIRRYLVTNFYQIISKIQEQYVIELSDFTKNNEYHYKLQQKIKCISDVLILLNKKEFHDDVIYYMTILS
jgi:hypothetical protein